MFLSYLPFQNNYLIASVACLNSYFVRVLIDLKKIASKHSFITREVSVDGMNSHDKMMSKLNSGLAKMSAF